MGFIKIGFFFVMIIVLFTIGIGVVSAETQFLLTPDEDDPDTEFGRSVATDGNLVAVGNGGDGAIGSVYLFRQQGRTYVLEDKLHYPDEIPTCCPEADPGTCPEFGRTVAIQGNTVFVGARFAPVDDGKNAGAVYVFQKQGDLWRYVEKIVSPVPQEGDNFGRALAVQGKILVVTARKNEAERGAAYVFTNQQGSWVYQSTINASDSVDGDYFGQSVALQGSFMVIGARNTNPNSAGGFYLFRRSGNDWIEVIKMTPEKGKKNDQFGFTIAISGDTIAVGARRADPGDLQDAGAVYLYSLNEGSVEYITKLTANDASAYDEFGQSVAFVGDILAVGAWKDDTDDLFNKDTGQGSLYLFREIEGEWIEIGKITNPAGLSGDEFGYSLAALGNRMVTGAHKADSGVGAAYVIMLTP